MSQEATNQPPQPKVESFGGEPRDAGRTVPPARDAEDVPRNSVADHPDSEPARHLSLEMVAALSTVVIGVCALAVSLYQAAIMRQQSLMMREEQVASVWPDVAVENSNTGEAFQLRIVDTGADPAKIGPVRVPFDQEPIRTGSAFGSR